MYYVFIKTQIIRLSNDISNIRTNEVILFKINWEFEKKKKNS